MNSFMSVDRLLESWLEDEAPPTAPGGLHASAIEAVRPRRQRPAWLVALRGGTIDGAARLARPTAPRAWLVLLAAVLVIALLGLAVLISASRPPKPSPQLQAATLKTAGSVPDAPGLPIAVALPNGRLVVGGSDGTSTIARLVDFHGLTTAPVLRSQAIATGLSSVRLMGATLLPDGRVFLFGWEDRVPVAEGRSLAWLFYPATLRLSDPIPTRESRFGAAVGQLADGRVMVLGGVSNPESGTALASTEIFDPGLGAFSAGPSLSTPRFDQSAVPLRYGSFLLAGGTSMEGGNLATITEVERFDPLAGTSRIVGSLSQSHPRSPLTLTRLPDDRVLIIEGQATGPCGRHGIDPVPTWLFDPVNDSLAAVPSVPHAVHSAAALPDGQVVITGSWQALPGGCGSGSDYVTDFWLGIYDPATGITLESRNPITGQGTLAADTVHDYDAAALLPEGRVALLAPDGGTTAIDLLTVAPR